jgi:putative transposase
MTLEYLHQIEFIGESESCGNLFERQLGLNQELLRASNGPGLLGLGITALIAGFMSGMAGNVSAFSTVWTYDIYKPLINRRGWLFLAVVIDLFSRKVKGWSMRPDLHRSLVIDALEMGLFQRRPREGELIFHSDRGSQYASEDFRQLLEKHGIMASMSRKGNCWDNAVTETLFASLKVERLHGERFETIRQAKDTVLAWLLWYNRQRMYSTLNYLSPAEFESRWENADSQAA